MQQVSVLSVSTAKGVDYKEETQTPLTGSDNKKDNFSAMVEKQINDDNAKKQDRAQASKNDNSRETNSIKDAAASTDISEKGDSGKNGHVEETDQDSYSAIQNKNSDNASTDDQITSLETESNDDVLSAGEEQTTDFAQSQQFLSLLYSADATLVDTELAGAESEEGLLTKDVSRSNQDQLSLALKNKNDLQELLLTDQEKQAQLMSDSLAEESTKGENVTTKEVPSSFNLNQVTKDLLSQANADTKFAKEGSLAPDKQAGPIKDIVPITMPVGELSSTELLDGASISKVSNAENAILNGVLENDKADKKINADALKNMSEIDLVKNAELSALLTEETLGIVDDPLEDEGKLIDKKLNVSESVANTKGKLLDNGAAEKIELVNQAINSELIDESVVLANNLVTNTLSGTNQSLTSTINQAETLAAQMNREKIAENINASTTDQSNNLGDDTSELIDKLSLDVVNGANDVKPAVVGQKTETTIAAELSATRMSSDIAAIVSQSSESAAQQSIEALNHNVGSDVIQIQKNNVSLQQETISIFRKDFADAVKDKVMVIISQKLQQFDIRLDPPELGNMHVRVNLQNEQAMVNFVVQNQQAKEALDQNMDRLKDMLAERGVDVGDANVEQQSQQPSNNSGESSGQHGSNGGFSDEEISMADGFITLSADEKTASGVDFYA